MWTTPLLARCFCGALIRSDGICARLTRSTTDNPALGSITRQPVGIVHVVVARKSRPNTD